MLSFIAKAAFSGILVALVTVVAKRHPGWGGLLAALPITSILALALLWVDTRDVARVSALSTSVLAFVVPSLPLFVMLPPLLRQLGFWPALGVSVAVTLALYAATFALLARLGVAV